MTKKIISLVLALIVVASMGAIAFTASAASQTIYFEVPSNWNNYTNIFCHVWVYNGDALANWQSKKEKCTLESDGRYSYDLSKVGGIDSSSTYCVIFSADTGVQTYDTFMGTPCIGDTLYCDGTTYENPVDSSKTALAAFWRNQSRSAYGPVMCVSSIGNLVGTCLAPGETAEGLFNTFLTANLESARTYSGKTDQQIIDDMATSLGLSQKQVDELIKASGISVDWKMEESKAPEQSKPISTPAATSTGQETTIVFVALGVMIAAAGVILFARKRVTQ
ncbi:MAG: LPXTG cell wall anchor domain-containing protein [Eubacteriales bacterium]|nr:LPXTG cell wall anchor domain-containing protein [Eubacteriales bacterium]